MIKLFVFATLLLSANFIYSQNIMISKSNSPNEPSIMLDPKHPNVIIAGANIDNYYISLDTGRTWVSRSLYSAAFGVWGDPTIVVDTNSNFYFFHLSNPMTGSWIDRIVCQKTTNNGTIWNDGSAVGKDGVKAQDKQWCAINRKNNHIFLTWTQFDLYGSKLSSDSSTILFSKSLDAGETWSNPKRLNTIAGDCIDSDNTVEGAVPCVGPNGETYVCWAGPEGLLFTKSNDEGETWLKKEIWVDSIPGGWDFDISGINRCNGLPIIDCDLSNGKYKGTIYINWSDQRNGSNNTDIWLKKSTDGGLTWSTRKRVNQDQTESQQFFTWMTIDQTTGYLYFVFYDRSKYKGDSTDVVLAISKDGGASFTNYKISNSPFVPNNQIFFGDYTNITVYNGIIRPIWTRLHNGQISVWTNLTNYDELTSLDERVSGLSQINEFENYPNPAHEFSYVSYKIHDESVVNLSISDNNGKIVAVILNNEIKPFGKYIETINLSELNLPSGVYFIKLEINNKSEINRMVVIK